MDQIEFDLSYAVETLQTGGPGAPGMNVQTPGGARWVPVRIMIMTMESWTAVQMDSRIGPGSAHEITFAVVCDQDEMPAISLLTGEYARKAMRSERRVSPADVARTLEQLASV